MLVAGLGILGDVSAVVVAAVAVAKAVAGHRGLGFSGLGFKGLGFGLGCGDGGWVKASV